MTDNEIIKALECCSTPNCKGCPFDSQDCVSVDLYSLALALINRQNETIEQLKTALFKCGEETVEKQETINHQKAEIEEMEKTIDEKNEELERVYDALADEVKILSDKRAEAVREFAEMVKEKIRTMSRIVVYDEDIDNLVKEFTEGG